MAAYQTVAEFKALTLIPATWVDDLELNSAGFVTAQLEHWSDWLNVQLRKRYGVPFDAPYPVTVVGWLNRIVTWRCLIKRGIDPTDQQFAQIVKDSDDAYAEVAKAADSEHGLFDLPLRADLQVSGIINGPRVYSEQSPYVGFDRQRQTGRQEDLNSRGTGEDLDR